MLGTSLVYFSRRCSNTVRVSPYPKAPEIFLRNPFGFHTKTPLPHVQGGCNNPDKGYKMGVVTASLNMRK